MGTSSFKKAFGIGLLFTIAQLLMCLVVSPPPTAPTQNFMRISYPPGWNESLGRDSEILFRYVRLNNWDSYHFFSIAKNGYQLTPGQLNRDDINDYKVEYSFLPAFPIISRYFSKVSSVPLEISQPFIAQIFCLLFWSFLFLIFMDVCGLSENESVFLMFLFGLLPGSFYLVTAYSESLVLASICGFILFSENWVRSKRTVFWILAGAFGLMISSSRMVGVAFSIYPVFWSFNSKFDLKSKIGIFLLGGPILLGTASYLYFCFLKTGHWDIYFKLANVGWFMKTAYIGALNPLLYVPRFFFEFFDVSMNRLFTLMLALTLGFSIYKDSLRKIRAHYYAAAFMLFYITVAGKVNSDLDGMIRYVLPVFLILVIAVTQAVPDFFKSKFSFRTKLFFVVTACLLLSMEWVNAYRFMHGRWVS